MIAASSQNWTPRRTAYHEAGHVLVAWLFRCRIEDASIVKQEESWGRVHACPPLDPVRRVALYVAGYVAEHRFCGSFDSSPGDKDLDDVADALAPLYPARKIPVDADEFRKGLVLACRMIDSNRALVRRIARRLLDEHDLDQAAIARLLHGVPRLHRSPVNAT